MSRKSDDDFLALARARAEQSDAADQKTRELERLDLRMAAGDQWDAEVRLQREGGGPGSSGAGSPMPVTPPRPCITIDKLRAPVRHALAQEQQADFGIELVPADDFGDGGPIPPEEVQLREGLCRRIQRDSDARDARTWAFKRAVQCGRGYYLVLTRYGTGATFDQEVYISRIYNQFSVRLDPTSEQPDGSDAEWAQIGTDMRIEEFRALFPKADLTKMDDDDLRALGDEQRRGLGEQSDQAVPAAVGVYRDGTHWTVRVVDYWYSERTSRARLQLKNGQEAWKDEYKGAKSAIVAERDIPTRTVKWAKLGAYHEILEETDWPSEFLPVVQVLGEELQPYDSERRTQGMIRPGIDAQRGFNAMISKQVETVALTPIAPLMMPAGMQEGFEEWFAAMNTRTLPYLLYNPEDETGKPFGVQPVRPPTETPLQAIAQSVAFFDQAIKATTETPDPTLGNVDPSLRSGRAVKTLVDQAAQSTSGYLENLRRAMEHEGRIINSLLEPIYGTPGRIVRILQPNGDKHTATIGQNLTLTPNADFLVSVKISKSRDTRREQEAADLSDLLQSAPQLMNVIGDLYFKNQDGPGSQELAARMRMMLAPPIQQMLSGQQPIPPQVQQQMAAQGKLVEELTAHVNQMTQIINTKQVEAQAKLQEAQMDNASRERIAWINVTAQLATAQAKIDAENARTFIDAAEQRESKLLDLHMKRLDAAETAMGQAHELGLQAHAQVHDRLLSAQEHLQDSTLQDQAHQQAMAQAAVAPPAASDGPSSEEAQP